MVNFSTRLSDFWQPWSLRSLFVFVVGVPVSLLFGILFIYGYCVNRTEAAKSLRIHMVEEVTTRAKQLDRHLGDLVRKSDRTALAITMRTPQSIDEMISFQRAILEDEPIIYGNAIGWEPYAFDPKEKYCCPYVWRDLKNGGNLSTMMFCPENNYDYLTGWDWYDKPKEEYQASEKSASSSPNNDAELANFLRYKPGLWSVPYFDEGGGNVLMCTYSVPFFKQQKFAGVVTCDITTDWLADFLINQPFRGGFFVLLAQNGMVVSHPDSSWVKKHILELASEKRSKKSPNWDGIIGELNAAFQSFEAESKQRHHHTRKDEVYLPGLSREVQGFFLPETVWTEGVQLSSTGWVLICIVPKNTVFEQSNVQYQWNFLIFIFGILLLSINLYWFINRKIIKPIHSLTAATTNIAKGNFDQQIETYNKSGSEMLHLSQNFNIMSATLRRSIAVAVQNATSREMAETASRTKGKLLMLVSHELRTPLSGVIGTADLLLKTPLTEKQQEYTLIQKESGLMLLHVINNILDYSKLEFGDVKIEGKDFNLQRLISDTIQTLRFHARSYKTTVKEELSPDISHWVHGDETRIQQVLLNLLNNAIKFSANSEVIIRVVREGLSIKMSNSKDEPAVQLVRFEIVDHGVGIPKEKQDNIFTPNADTTDNIDGLGIGLVISKYIIEALHGTIGVHSDPGKGTTFYFTLPLTSISSPMEDSSNEPTVITKITEETHPDLSQTEIFIKKKILVAEDNRINQIVIQEMLTTAGYDCVIVENGKKAVQIWSEQKFDLILMDCQMPEMDGYEATEKIRDEEMRSDRYEKQIPIIALTANAAPGDKEHCLNVGMNAYCNKPIKSQELNDLIKQLTESHLPLTAS